MTDIEKSIVSAMEPVVDELLEIKKRVDEIELTPGPQGDPGLDGKDAENIEVDPDVLASVLAKDYADEIRGAAGRDGVDGIHGKDGQDGLGLEVDFYAKGAVYREGTYVTHNMGQFFKSLKDTFSEPGTSDDWERVGRGGFRWCRHVKGGEGCVDGDLYIDGGSCFLWWNGKGHMVVKRGADGAEGEKGGDGKDAPEMMDGVWTDKGIEVAMSDGSVKTFDTSFFVGAVEQHAKDLARQYAIEEAGHAKQGLMEAITDEILGVDPEDVSTPIRFFKGEWNNGNSYSRGDVVTYGSRTYICINAAPKSVDLTDEYWKRFAAGSTGGGGGGGGGDMVAVRLYAEKNFIKKTDAIDVSSGPLSLDKVPKLNVNGKLDSTFLSIPGGMTLRGSIAATSPPPASPTAGDYYIVGADGVLDAGFGLGALAVKKGDTLLFSGTDWIQDSSQVDLTTVYTKSQIDTKLSAFSGGLKFQKITAADYNALPTKDISTLYLVSG